MPSTDPVSASGERSRETKQIEYREKLHSPQIMAFRGSIHQQRTVSWHTTGIYLPKLAIVALYFRLTYGAASDIQRFKERAVVEREYKIKKLAAAVHEYIGLPCSFYPAVQDARGPLPASRHRWARRRGLFRARGCLSGEDGLCQA